MKTHTKAAIFLLFFAPINAELLSGSSPPVEFFSPPGLLMLVPLYGLGALVVHDLTTRWKKGWPTIMLLGLAYGIIEEGVLTMSFFNPNWADVGVLGSFGRAFGVNWVWSFNLAIFHGIFSISVPILVMRLIFPQLEGQILLWRRPFRLAIFLFALTIAVETILIAISTRFVAEPLPYLGAIVAIILLIYAARRAPYHLLAIPREKPSREPLRIALAGFGFAFGFFLLQYVAPAVFPGLAIGVILLMLVLASAAARFFEKNLGISMNGKQKVAMVIGLESVWVFFAFIQEFASSIPNTLGMSLVSLGYVLFFIWLWRTVSRREMPSVPSRPHPAPPA